MLIKRGRTLREAKVFLERVKNSDFPYACDFCLFRNRKCNNLGFDCNDYDTHNYSYYVIKKYKILKCVNTLSSSIGKLIMKRYCTQRYKCNICILYSNLFERKYCTYYIYRTLTVIYTVSVCCYKFTTPDYQYIPTKFTQLIDYC